ncbi:MAG: hypothetical protein ACFFD4_09405 [Candidatus Odinarchaeota archaeon]
MDGNNMEFKVYQAMPDGDYVEVRFKGQETLWKDKVFIIEAKEARRVFIWVGSKANIRDKFAASRIAEQLRREVGMTCRIMTEDEGNESNEFLETVNLPRRDDVTVQELLTADEIRNQAVDSAWVEKPTKTVEETLLMETEHKTPEKQETSTDPQEEKIEKVSADLPGRDIQQAKRATGKKECITCREKPRYGLDNRECMTCNRNPLFIPLKDNWKPATD